MYDVFLFVHSWFRWIVLVAGLRLYIVLAIGHIKKKAWTAADSKAVSQFNESLLYQAALGLGLYLFLSPLPKIGWSNMSFALKDPAFRFWTLEHPIGMISGLIVFQIGRMLAIKKYSLEKRFKVLLISFTIAFLIIVASVPWPFLKHGRNLFRFVF